MCMIETIYTSLIIKIDDIYWSLSHTINSKFSSLHFKYFVINISFRLFSYCISDILWLSVLS